MSWNRDPRKTLRDWMANDDLGLTKKFKKKNGHKE